MKQEHVGRTRSSLAAIVIAAVVLAHGACTKNPCGCADDEICVQFYGGICRSQAPDHCMKKTVKCPQPVCTPECDQEACGFPPDAGTNVTCVGFPCAGMPSDVIICKGP
jgi:hypothetical protein